MKCRCEKPALDPNDIDVCATCHFFHREPYPRVRKGMVITIDLEELDRLRKADADLYEYRLILGGRTPAEVNQMLDHILELQDQIKKEQANQSQILDDMLKKLNK
jgi:hypothetical protein